MNFDKVDLHDQSSTLCLVLGMCDHPLPAAAGLPPELQHQDGGAGGQGQGEARHRGHRGRQQRQEEEEGWWSFYTM